MALVAFEMGHEDAVRKALDDHFLNTDGHSCMSAPPAQILENPGVIGGFPYVISVLATAQ